MHIWISVRRCNEYVQHVLWTRLRFVSHYSIYMYLHCRFDRCLRRRATMRILCLIHEVKQTNQYIQCSTNLSYTRSTLLARLLMV